MMRQRRTQIFLLGLMAVAFVHSGVQACCCSVAELEGDNGIRASQLAAAPHGCCGEKAPCEKPLSKGCRVRAAVAVETRAAGTNPAQDSTGNIGAAPALVVDRSEGAAPGTIPVSARASPCGKVPIILLKSSLLI